MKRIKTRASRIISAAQNGSIRAQEKLAKRCYFGKGIERNIAAAQYWAYKAIDQGSKRAERIFNATQFAHMTGNEYYTGYTGYHNITLTSGEFFSEKLRGHYDRHKENPAYYRSYNVIRFLLFFYVKGAFRVYDNGNGFNVIGKEKMRFFEYCWWYLFDLLVIGGLLWLVFS